jgi:acyl carrier protein
MPTQPPTHATLLQIVLDGLREVLVMSDRPMPELLDEATSLIGKQAVLDSLALVTLIVDLEQRIEEEYDVALTIADDRAMSQKHSPFRSVGALTAYLDELLAEELNRG